MPLLPVAAADDPRLAPYRSLKKTNATRDAGAFVAEGDKLVRRLLERRWPLDSVLLSDRWLDRLRPELPDDLPVLVADHALLQDVVGFPFHRGVLACARRPEPPTLDSIERGRRLVVCPNVTDPANLGAIARSAAAFGWDALAVGPSGPEPFTRRVLRVSMGAVLGLPVAKLADPAAWLRRLSDLGFAVLGATLGPGATPFDALPSPDRLALVLGNEDEGLSPDVLAACTLRVAIPILPAVDSLNVAVAAGILCCRFGRVGSR